MDGMQIHISSADDSESEPFEVPIETQARHMVEKDRDGDKGDRVTEREPFVFSQPSKDLFRLIPHRIVIRDDTQTRLHSIEELYGPTIATTITQKSDSLTDNVPGTIEDN